MKDNRDSRDIMVIVILMILVKNKNRMEVKQFDILITNPIMIDNSNKMYDIRIIKKQ